MMNVERFHRIGDRVERPRTSVLEVDRLLTELGQLYLERFKALRSGDPHVLQQLTDRIALIRMKLNQL
jgi:type II secretory pathway predicted ATPase ExeA